MKNFYLCVIGAGFLFFGFQADAANEGCKDFWWKLNKNPKNLAVCKEKTNWAIINEIYTIGVGVDRDLIKPGTCMYDTFSNPSLNEAQNSIAVLKVAKNLVAAAKPPFYECEPSAGDEQAAPGNPPGEMSATVPCDTCPNVSDEGNNKDLPTGTTGPGGGTEGDAVDGRRAQ